jgi:hypothetical protein
MTTKKIFIIVFVLWAGIGILSARTASFKITIEALDLAGNPINDARVGYGYDNAHGPNRFGGGHGFTDGHGKFTASGQLSSFSEAFIAISLTKEGYYPAMNYPFRTHTSRLRRWYPWDPLITMVMRDIRNPIRMHWKRQTGFMPDGEKAVGYDFEVGDWVAPHGKGRTADIIFSSESWAETTSHYDGTLTLSFPNEGDGIQEFRVNTAYHPTLLSDYAAPEDGYESVLLHRSRSNVKLEGEVIAPNVGHDPDQHFYLRTRTVLDANGNVVSAHYSKWKGGIMYLPQTAHSHVYKNHRFQPPTAAPQLTFTYFFNPTANDRNMEHARSNNPPLPGSEFDSPNHSFGTNGQRNHRRSQYTPGSTPNRPAAEE